MKCFIVFFTILTNIENVFPAPATVGEVTIKVIEDIVEGEQELTNDILQDFDKDYDRRSDYYRWVDTFKNKGPIRVIQNSSDGRSTNIEECIKRIDKKTCFFVNIYRLQNTKHSN